MSVSKEFVLAGNAHFTVQLPPGGDRTHCTYRVRKVEGGDRWPDAWFVSLLTGPDNTTSYTYVGKLDLFTAQVKVTQKSKLPQDAFPLRLLNRVLPRVWSGDHLAYEKHGYLTRHADRCGRCGRQLTTPRSLDTGIGPECEKILGKMVNVA